MNPACAREALTPPPSVLREGRLGALRESRLSYGSGSGKGSDPSALLPYFSGDLQTMVLTLF